MNIEKKITRRAGLTGALAGAGALAAPAQSQTPRSTSPEGHKVVLEVTSGASEQWDGALNNVQNLQKAFTAERVHIEVVAHGKGLTMLLKSNASQASRLEDIARSGVTFAACENSMRRLKVTRSDLFSFAAPVPSGVAEIVLKQEAGWSYLKTGT